MASVSVIIPVYNGKKHLKQCLNSVLSQTLKDIEIICVDDGSADGSDKIIKKYAAANANIKPITVGHEGSGAARNRALEIAQGKYVCFMDCDDWYYADNVLELLYTKAEENNADICGGSFCEYYPKENVYRTDFDKYLYGYTFKEDGRIEYKDYQFDFGYHRFIYNREFLRRNSLRFPDYLRYQDVVFFVKAMCAAEWFYAVKDVVYCYRMHDGVYGNMTPERLDGQTEAMCEMLEFAAHNELDGLFELTCSRMAAAADIMAEMIISERGNCSPDNLLNLYYGFLKVKGEIPHSMAERTVEETSSVIDRQVQRTEGIYYGRYMAIKNSLSFKLGRAITFLPRKFRDLFEK